MNKRIILQWAFIICSFNLYSQDLLPESQKYAKDSTIVEEDYIYQCEAGMGMFITLYNKENKWVHSRNVYTSSGKTYVFDGTDDTNNIVPNQQMVNLAYNIVDNAFTKNTANTFGNRKIGIAMYLDALTGKVIEVTFDFLAIDPYARIPISVYRDIELKLKEQISFTTTDVGKQLNYIMLSWNQRPKGALPPITPIE